MEQLTHSGSWLMVICHDVENGNFNESFFQEMIFIDILMRYLDSMEVGFLGMVCLLG